jgi:hypothetical protein
MRGVWQQRTLRKGQLRDSVSGNAHLASLDFDDSIIAAGSRGMEG